MNRILKKRILILFLLAAGFLVFSCTTRATKRFAELEKATDSGNYSAAIKTIQNKKKLYGKTNKYLWYMDLGVLYHYAGKYDSSNTYLGHALETYDDLFAKSVTNEAASILVNDNIRPYRSKPYELVLAHHFKGLNYQIMNKNDEALVETRQTQLMFQEWDRTDKKGVKYHSDGMFHYMSSIAYDAVGETDNSMISLFKSVEAYNQGVVALPLGIKDYAYHMLIKNDRENDTKLLKISTSAPTSKIPGLNNDQTEIIFIGNAGKGPVIKEEKWWGTWVADGIMVLHHTGADGSMQTLTLPAPGIGGGEYEKARKGRKTRSGTTFHVKFTLPKLVTRPSRSKSFTVNHKSLSSPVKTEIIANYDRLGKQHMVDTHKATIIRTVIRVVIRTISAQKTKKAVSGSNPLANLLLNIFTDVAADQLEKADTRSCFLIPKTIQIARIPVEPGTHSLDVTVNGTGEKRTFDNIQIKKGQKKFVFLASIK